MPDARRGRPRNRPVTGNHGGPRVGTGGTSYTGGSKHKGGPSSCSMWAPVAVAMLPYALVRMGIDAWRGRP